MDNSPSNNNSNKPAQYNNDGTPSYRSMPPPAPFFGSAYRDVGSSGLPSMNPAPSVYRSIKLVGQAQSGVQQARSFGAGVLSKPQLHQQSAPGKQKLAAPSVVVTPNNTVEPELPFFPLENTNFNLRGQIKQLLEVFEHALGELDIDFVFKAAKCKWKAVSYCQNNKLDMRVYLYAHQLSGVYTFEFQRRSGCGMHFSRVYKGIVSFLTQKRVMCNSAGHMIMSSHVAPVTAQQVNRKLAPLPFPCRDNQQQQNSHSDEQTDKQCVQALVEMAKGEFMDMRMQAIVELANQTEKACVRTTLIATEGFLALLLGLMAESKNECFVRCCVSMLCNFAQDTVCHQQLVEAGTIQQFVAVVTGAPFCVETKRRAVCALVNLLKGQYRQAVLDQGASNLFSSLEQSNDRRLQQYVREAQQAMGVH